MKSKRFGLFVILVSLLALSVASCDSTTPPSPSAPGGNVEAPENNPGGQDSPDESQTQAHVHEYGDWTVTKEASCAAEGSQEKTCSCGHRQTVALPKLEHTYSSQTWACSECGAAKYTAYSGYSDYAQVCSVTETNGVVTMHYNSAAAVRIDLNHFSLDGGKTYVFVFGSEAGAAMISSEGALYGNVRVVVENHMGSYDLVLRNVQLQNNHTVLKSDAATLKLGFYGNAVGLQTMKAAGGSDGESFGAFQIGNGGPGGNGANASAAIECNGKLDIVCGADTAIRGGDGGNGGNGGNSDSSGSSGGQGGNGGNGAHAIKADSIQVSFDNGKDKSNLTLLGGAGGSGGSGGKGAFLFGIGGSYAPNGSGGSSAPATNVEVQYN